MAEDDKEWTEVRRKKTERLDNGRRRQRENGFRRSSGKDIFESRATTFYITNFSNRSTEADLWGIFKKIGKVVDVYVARKSNKSGARFGFARFLGITDKVGFERKLNNTWVGNCRLLANVARFGRDTTGKKETRKSFGTEEKEGEKVNLNAGYKAGPDDKWKAVKSFADVVKGDKSSKEGTSSLIQCDMYVLSWSFQELVEKDTSRESC
ncbi:hypothetical protein OSB04_020654 [Centaurea solstitialis]|uniref:RRM domain-containing protein n=1 Tax=Centaurea solstitialis TaxID=347529 RepID=A0AA38T422_9ASTR|nr:hypothetical protein OSB04_020654 [Centaurea solstitialis]